MENTKKVAAAAATIISESEKKRLSQEKESLSSDKKRLSLHFVLREFTLSGTAIRNRIDNTPTAVEVERLRALCVNVLEPLRRRFGVLRITSGYRSERLNSLVGGAKNSQHRLGEAADIHVSSREVAQKMCDYVRNNLDFDQLILESSKKMGVLWLHVSYKARGNRKEFFTIKK